MTRLDWDGTTLARLIVVLCVVVALAAILLPPYNRATHGRSAVEALNTLGEIEAAQQRHNSRSGEKSPRCYQIDSSVPGQLQLPLSGTFCMQDK